MNKNEKQQLDLFKKLVNKHRNRTNDLFFGALNFKYAKEPYDVVVEFKNSQKKHVQLTTMSNLVSGKHTINHANKIDPKIDSYFKNGEFNAKLVHNSQKKLKRQNIKREIISIGKEDLLVKDKYNNYSDTEKNLDAKYGIDTKGLINALYRAVARKRKYDFPSNLNSVLVVIDESQNLFGFSKNNNEGWGLENYFLAILQVVIKETNILNSFKGSPLLGGRFILCKKTFRQRDFIKLILLYG